MPFCYKCKQPVFFLAERPEWKSVGSYMNPQEIRTDPRPIPIDINPDNVNGSIAVYEYPSPTCVWGKDQPGRQRYMRRLYHEAAKAWLRSGGVLFRSHFDTCQARR